MEMDDRVRKAIFVLLSTEWTDVKILARAIQTKMPKLRPRTLKEWMHPMVGELLEVKRINNPQFGYEDDHFRLTEAGMAERAKILEKR